MKTMRYRILNDNYFPITEGADYDKLSDGGFVLTSFCVLGGGYVMLQFY